MTTQPTITVFVENEAGSSIKHHYNERTLEFLRTEDVGGRYPYPYGFVPGTLAADGDSADCFILTNAHFRTGTTVECEPIALVEQTEGGTVDNNVLAVLPGEPTPDLNEVTTRLGVFFDEFMKGHADRKSVMGRLMTRQDALDYIEECRQAAMQ